MLPAILSQKSHFSGLFRRAIFPRPVEQRNKYFALKESLNVKKVYKLVDGDHQKIDLITGLNSGGYTEIIKGELSEGDEVISKITLETTSKKALRLF